MLTANQRDLSSGRMCSFCRSGRIFPVILALGLAVVSVGYAQSPGITTPREAVTNIYHGVAVVEDDRWLEEATKPAVRDWTRQQNERTRAYFDRLKTPRNSAPSMTQSNLRRSTPTRRIIRIRTPRLIRPC